MNLNILNCSVTPLLLIVFSSCLQAADRFWDGTAANVAGNGNSASTYAAGTWSTSISNWDAGAAPHVLWINANVDTAIFGGTYAVGGKVITLGSSVTVNQIKILTGDPGSATSGNRYDIGVASDATNAITFGGTYSTSTPAIDASATNVRNTQFAAKITGNLTASGGLVVAHGSNGADPSSGRIAFTNAANDFVGDIVLVSGNLGTSNPAHQNYGNAANKIILSGGSLFNSGNQATPHTLARNIEVAANSGINLNATGTLILDLTGTITGAANLTRYNSANTGGEVRFSGGMSGFTGTIENTGVGGMTIQSTATSGGAWKLTGGTVKLNTSDNTHIANGAGMSNLLMNGGALNMNGKSETINGLAGATGFVQNELLSTISTLTLGDADATASFGGTIRNNAGTGGTMALTKIGTGAQTLGGTNSYTGITTISAGSLLISGSLGNTSVTANGTLGGSGAVAGTVALSGGTIDPGGDGGDRSLTLNGNTSGSGIIALTIDSTSNFDKILGAGILDTSSISLNVTMNDSGWTVATDAAGLATATQYDIVANSVTGNFTNGLALSASDQTYWGVGANAKYFNFGGQDFLLTVGSYKLTAITIPEPSAWALAGLSALGLALRRRRQ